MEILALLLFALFIITKIRRTERSEVAVGTTEVSQSQFSGLAVSAH